MALLNSGFNIDEPSYFTEPLEKLIRVGFGVGREAPCEEIEITLDEPEVEEDVGIGYEVDEDEEPEEIPIMEEL